MSKTVTTIFWGVAIAAVIGVGAAVAAQVSIDVQRRKLINEYADKEGISFAEAKTELTELWAGDDTKVVARSARNLEARLAEMDVDSNAYLAEVEAE